MRWAPSRRLPKSRGRLDGFIVATPTATHAEVVESLLSYGVPIFVEKPLTPSVEAARRLVRLAGERIFVMDKWRYHPGIEALRDQARSGALGDIRAVRSFRLGWGNPHRDVDAIWILIPHDFAIAYEILGYLPAAQAAYTSLRGNAGSDLVAVLGGHQGCAVVAEISAFHPISRRAVTVIGTKGSAQLGDSYDDRIFLAAAGSPAGAKPIEIPLSAEMPLRRELTAFLAHIDGGPPPRSSAAEGLLVVERIAEIRRLAGLD